MQINLFAEETQLQRLSELGDSLEKLNVIDFESFRPLLEKVNCKERKSKAGRPSYDVVMMFKIRLFVKSWGEKDSQPVKCGHGSWRNCESQRQRASEL